MNLTRFVFASRQNLQDEHIPRLLHGIRGALDDPENAAAQQNLITASNDFVPVKSLHCCE